MGRARAAAARIGIAAWVGFCMLGVPVASMDAQADDPLRTPDPMTRQSGPGERVPSTETQVTDDADAALNIRLPPEPEDEDRAPPIVAPPAKPEVVAEPVAPSPAPPVAAAMAETQVPPPAPTERPVEPAEPAAITAAADAPASRPTTAEPTPDTGDAAGLVSPVLPQVLPLALPLASAPPSEPVSYPLAPDVIAGLLRRADDLLAAGDVLSARLLYERAAAGGSAAGATGVAKTYDPPVLDAVGARGIRSDPEQAATWYRKAIALGDDTASVMLRKLTDKTGP